MCDGCMQVTVWIEPDNIRVYATQDRASPVCGGGDPECCGWREHLQGLSGINSGCSRMKQISQDSAAEVRKEEVSVTMREKSPPARRETAPSALTIRHGMWLGACP